MTERERFIELLKDGGVRGFPYVNALADHLLANGVIAPPVKIGQTVYDYAGRECVVFGIHFFYEGINVFATERIEYNGRRIHTTHSFDKIDETVFLTREEAEKALAERSKT